MAMEHCDILIIGAGATGIAAAETAWNAGCKSILLVDRKSSPGGILLQCLHRGFGAGLDGPEYISNLLRKFPEEIPCLHNASVVSVSADKTALLRGPEFGEKEISFRQLILAAGCLEIPMGALPIAGTRPRGIYTAGQMQEMMNLHGFRPEGPVAILGSGDLGLIMAKHLYEVAIPVAAIIEQKEACGGMARNRQFLPESGIEELCGLTVSQVRGYPRLEAVVLSDGRVIPCKTLLIAVGLRPDRTLAHNLENKKWLHLCGNCSKIYPMVEGVIQDGRQAALRAVSALSIIEK
jgi:sarcosine oxidase subunit alpha